jgi:hypothetical protein
MRVFLSYRRDDSAGRAGRLHDALEARLGRGSVFQDVSTIDPGEDFVQAVTSAIARCDVVLVLIGPHWHDMFETAEGEQDYVALEIQTALDLGKRTIPVTVGDATLPEPHAVPEVVRPLLFRQGFELRDTNWNTDVEAFIDALRDETASDGPNKRRMAIAATGLVAAFVVLLLLWQPWSGSGDDDSASRPECDPSLETDAGWTAIELAPDPTGVRDFDNYEARAAGYQATDPGTWALQVRVRITNEHTEEESYNEDWKYEDGLIVDTVQYTLTCFTPLIGKPLLAPGLSGEALIGVELPVEPRGDVAIAQDPPILIASLD